VDDSAVGNGEHGADLLDPGIRFSEIILIQDHQIGQLASLLSRDAPVPDGQLNE